MAKDEKYDEQFYIEMIQKLKTGEMTVKDVEIEEHKPEDDIDVIIGKLDELNKEICELSGAEFKPISGIVDFYIAKGNAFDDERYEKMFNVECETPVKQKLTNTKKLDYGFREKLTGFVSSTGCLGWNDDRIDGFLRSIKRANFSSKPVESEHCTEYD